MANTKQILFGGVGRLPPRKAEFKKPKPGDRPMWYELYEAAFDKLSSTDEGRQLYGDPAKGATLEQVWRTTGVLSGKLTVCLLSTDQPSVATDAIDRLIRMSSKEIVDVLIGMSGMKEIRYTTILFFDGHMGHCIYFRDYDNKKLSFVYHDPWPGDSLLCRDFNAAGIDAQPKDRYWTITATELEKVIFAALVYRPLWSEYMGEKYYTTYDEFKTSDFWTFFHLKEVDRNAQNDDGNMLIKLKTGGFQSEIDLSVTMNQKNRLVEGLLSVKRSWVIGPPYGLNPFALDIVRSFIAALTPPPDQDAVSRFINMLHQIEDPAYAEQLVNEGLEKSILHQALFTYLGPSPSFEAIFQFSNISMKNIARDGEDWLQTMVTTDAL